MTETNKPNKPKQTSKPGNTAAEFSGLDKLIATFAPQWALNRLVARMGIQAYEAAKASRLHPAKKTTGSINQAIGREGVSLREQARYLEQNTDTVDGLLSVLVNNIIGKSGIGVEPMPVNYDGSVNPELAKQLLDEFSEWSVKVDSTHTWSRPEIERLICRAWLRDGECFGELLKGKIRNYRHPHITPFSVQVMESDFLPFENTTFDGKITQGIELNPYGQPTGYHVLTKHPGDQLSFKGAFDTREIKADNMLHVKLVKRLHQLRGVSILASSMLRLAGLANYEESELVAARIAAAMAFYIKKGDSGSFDMDNSNTDKRNHISIKPGTVFDDLEAGEDVGTIESKRPNALMQNFRDTMVRMVCSATGANFSTVAKLYDGNYSAQRQELVESYLSYGVMSDAFIAQWSRPVYRNFVAMAIASGRITLPSGVNPKAVATAYYQPPVMPWIDPLKEANANTKLVESGFSTESEVIRARAKNPAEVKKRRLMEIEENRLNNLVYGSDAFHKFYGSKGISREETD